MPPPVPPSGEGRADDGGKAGQLVGLQRLQLRGEAVFFAALKFCLGPFGLEGGSLAPAAGCLPQAVLVSFGKTLLQVGRVDEGRARHLQPDLLHGGAEQVAVLGLVDGFGARADHLHVPFFQHALLVQ